MNISKKTKTLTFLAILVAIMLVMGFTPLGFIPLGVMKITLMCLPVIIGTLTLGLKTGVMLGVVFFITSFVQLLIAPAAVDAMLFEASPAYLLCLLIPRLLIPITTYFSYKGFSKLIKSEKKSLSIMLSALIGSLTNTFVYLLMLYFMFAPVLQEGLTLSLGAIQGMLTTIILTNGLPEGIFAALVCPPIVIALRKSVLLLEGKKA